MLRLISSSLSLTGSQLPSRVLAHQSKFFYRRRHQVQPLMRMRKLSPVYPPPGFDLELPDWTAETFLLKIGGGCSEHADKFESLEEVFKSDREQMKEKGIPPAQRKCIIGSIDLLRRGILSFEYLGRRTTYTLENKKTKK